MLKIFSLCSLCYKSINKKMLKANSNHLQKSNFYVAVFKWEGYEYLYMAFTFS
jgi:hypothetical protein